MARSNTKTSRTNEQTPIGIINSPPSRSTPSRLLVGIAASLSSAAVRGGRGRHVGRHRRLGISTADRRGMMSSPMNRGNPDRSRSFSFASTA